MKVNMKSTIWMFIALFLLALNAPANAQDDLYFDPSTDTKPVPTIPPKSGESDNFTTSNGGGDDQFYYEEDDYAYEYSSRIRRFHEPSGAMDYYDPFFVDLYHYDPYYLPGATIYTYGYNDYWAYRRMQRWYAYNPYNPYNPWNPYAGYGYGAGPGWGMSFGWGGYRPYPYSPWYNPCVWNNYYYDPYWTYNGHNPYYDNCAVGNSYYYYNNNNYYNGGNNGGNNGYQPQTYTGPRRGGTTIGNGGGYARLTSGTGSSNGRLTVADNKAPVININPRVAPSRDVVDKQRAMAEQQVDRAVPSTARQPATTTAKDPAAVEGSGRSNKKAEKTRPAREAMPGDNVPANRTPTETRPSRQPSPQTSPARSQETRPSRPSGGSNEAARPSRPSSEDRPSRSIETRPSRSSGSGESRTISPSSSGRSSGGNSGSSGRSSSGGNSSGGGSKSSGGGKSGRN
jgi:hypothetical protein